MSRLWPRRTVVVAALEAGAGAAGRPGSSSAAQPTGRRASRAGLSLDRYDETAHVVAPVGSRRSMTPASARTHRGDYHLFVGPCGSYSGGRNSYICTDIFTSDDPLLFTRAHHAGRLAAHAGEVVQDGDGDWFITHAGWGQGGVHLAPLHWARAERRTGVRARTAAYEADLRTSPTCELVSLRRPGGPNLLDTAYRGTAPYAGIGGYGDSAFAERLHGGQQVAAKGGRRLFAAGHRPLLRPPLGRPHDEQIDVARVRRDEEVRDLRPVQERVVRVEQRDDGRGPPAAT